MNEREKKEGSFQPPIKKLSRNVWAWEMGVL